MSESLKDHERINRERNEDSDVTAWKLRRRENRRT
jgi:hypothetical protein